MSEPDPEWPYDESPYDGMGPLSPAMMAILNAPVSPAWKEAAGKVFDFTLGSSNGKTTDTNLGRCRSESCP